MHAIARLRAAILLVKAMALLLLALRLSIARLGLLALLRALPVRLPARFALAAAAAPTA
jgi:hypothetical protein